MLREAIDLTCSERRIAPQPAHSFHDTHCYTYFFSVTFSNLISFFTVQLYTSLPSVLCLAIHLLFLLLQYQQVPVDHRIYAWIRSITRHQFGCLEKQQHQTERRQVKLLQLLNATDQGGIDHSVTQWLVLSWQKWTPQNWFPPEQIFRKIWTPGTYFTVKFGPPLKHLDPPIYLPELNFFKEISTLHNVYY